MTTERVRGIETTKMVGSLLKKLYQEAWQAKEEKTKPIAYVNGYITVHELLRAMDIIPLMPENFSAGCASKHLSPKACEVAEAKGYSRELCSYFKTHMGYALEGENLPSPPGGGMPEPDLLIINRGACHLIANWWRILEKHYNVPTFMVDVPAPHPSTLQFAPEEQHLNYVIAQTKKEISFLEEHTGRKFDIDKLRETVRLSDLAAAYFNEAQNYRRAIPCPVGSEDMAACMAPMATLAGTQEAVDFYQELAKELKEKVEKKQGVIMPREKHRFIVDNIPPWHTLGFFNYLHKHESIGVIETYTHLYHVRMDPARPLESLARKACSGLTIQSGHQYDYNLLRLVRDWKVDAALFLANKSCRILSLLQPYQKVLLKDELGVPSLMLDVDHNDPRDYVEAEIKAKVDAFMEMLG